MTSAEDSQLKFIELLTIPIKSQSPEGIQFLKNTRQTMADIFFDKSKSNEDRMKVFDDLTKLHIYFGMKLPFALGEKKSGWKGPAPAVVIKEPSADERAYALDLFWKTALPLVDARVKSIIPASVNNYDLHVESDRKYYEELALIVWLGKRNERQN